MSKALEQVKTAIADALEAAGLSAVSAFSPEDMACYREPVAAIGLRTGESYGGAMLGYMGKKTDPVTDATAEVYGMQGQIRLSLDLYAPASMGVSGVDGALERVHDALLRSLPSGLTPKEFHWEEAGWDEPTGMFLRRGTLELTAVFLASITEDSPIVSDIILKGVVTN